MHIRDEHPSDIQRISHIQYNAFKGHPLHPKGAEPFEHLVVDRLRADKALSLSLLAEADANPVGHIAMSPAAVGTCRNGWHLLGPVGVLPSHQGQGIGSALINQSLDRMRTQGSLGIVLVGDPGFYVRFGFKNMEGVSYQGVPNQFVLVLPFTDVAATGEVVAHDAFHPV
jgi:putative acetyltransferase